MFAVCLPVKINKLAAGVAAASLLCALAWSPAVAVTPAERGQWQAAMGESGLRRIYSAGGDMGEIVNRVVSYQTAARVWQSQQNRPNPPAPGDISSRTDSWAAQNDTLIPIADQLARPLYARVMVRLAGREEEGLIRSRSDRLDLGVLYAPTSRSYIGVGIAAEESSSDVLYADGRARGQTFGPRFDAGIVLGPVWAAGIRYDYLHYNGESEVNVQTPVGRLNISRPAWYQRQYLQANLNARFNRSRLSWLPEGATLTFANTLQMIRTHHDTVTNSLGQRTSEPFGNNENLTLLRSGLQLNWSLTADGIWTAFSQVAFDYEVETNMNFPIDDRAGVVASAAVVRQIGRGKRVQVLLDRFQHMNDDRSRNSITLIGVIDF